MRETSPATREAIADAPSDAALLARVAVDAARAGDVETLMRALGAGVPIDTLSPRGDSLLMLASYHGQVDAVRALQGLRRKGATLVGTPGYIQLKLDTGSPGGNPSSR